MSFRMLRVLSIGIVLSVAPVQAALPPLARAAALYYVGHWCNLGSKKSGLIAAYSMLGLNNLGDKSIAKIAALDLKLVGHAVGKEFLTNWLPPILQVPILRPPPGGAALPPHHHLLNGAYDAGLKYLTLWEFYQRIAGVAGAWEKMHTKTLRITDGTPVGINAPPTSSTPADSRRDKDSKQTNTTSINTQQKADTVSWHTFPSVRDDDPIAVIKAMACSLYYGQPLEDIKQWGAKWGAELYNDHNTAMVALLHFVVSYLIVEGVTRKLGDAMRVVAANNGAPALNNPFPARLIKVGVGMAFSHAFQKPVMGFMEDTLRKVDLYDPEAQEVNDLAYLAAYKAPFAWDAIKAQYTLLLHIAAYVTPFVVTLRGQIPPKVLAGAAIVATAAIAAGIALTQTTDYVSSTEPSVH